MVEPYRTVTGPAPGHTSLIRWQDRTSSVKTLALWFNGLLNTPVFNQQTDERTIFFAVNRVTLFSSVICLKRGMLFLIGLIDEDFAFDQI